MMATASRPLPGERSSLHRLAEFSGRAPAPARLPPHALMRALRASLRMSQAQLAARAGLPQPHLARIELGRVDPQLSTVRRIFAALSCDLLVIPRLRKSPEEALTERIREKARRNVARVAGTMALERQEPGRRTVRRLILREEARLAAHPSSELWED